MATKKEIFKRYLSEYLKSAKQDKGRILNHVEDVTGLHRKACIRRFRTIQMRDQAWKDRRGGKIRYGPAVTAALKDVWELSGEICAERLYPYVTEYIRQCQTAKRWMHDDEATGALRAMSLGTLKDRIAGFDGWQGRRGRGTTKPSGIKEIVPVRKGPWDNPAPGYGEIDTVAHCGETTAGEYCYTVQYTDVCTAWTCLAAQWNKSEVATLESIKGIEYRLPFLLKGLDPDSGSEFINWHLVRWVKGRTPPVELTRTRPSMKNDHARIEQKNYVNVRRWAGYARFDDPAYLPVLRELYCLLEDYINFFIPSVMCVAKERLPQRRTKRIYGVARTAYERVIGRPDIDAGVKERLQAKYATLSMVALKQNIDALTKKLAVLKERLR